MTSRRATSAIAAAPEQAARVGPRGLNQPGGESGLGGVSTGLVTNATCRVEVVR